MSAEWIARNWAANPPRIIDGGNIIFGPVRGAFVNLLERPKPGTDGKERAYGLVALIPEGADLSVLKEAAKLLFKEKAPLALTNPEVARKYHNPFKKQEDYVDTKSGGLYDGFVAGRVAMAFNSSQSKPPVTDQKLAPIVDKDRCYSGAWFMLSVRPGWFKQQGKEGPTFYLQSAMVVADDDESLGGIGQSNPNKDFAGVSLDPSVNPAAGFGAAGPADDGEVDIFG